MFPPISLVAAATPSGDPTLKPGLDPSSVTPGTLGFLATLFVVVLVILLIRDMVKRIRRVRYTAEVEQARAQRAMQDPGDIRAGGFPPAEGAEASDPPRGADDTDRPGPGPGGKHGPDNR